ncbi:MAG: polyprenyl synthetase family protein [Candidatus Marinimicrobia bacterium]|nr:polyprenyl synthetase family protein [Candidatus Neomarinimicrobiota bacterium]
MATRLYRSLVQAELKSMEEKLAEIRSELAPGSTFKNKGKRLRPTLFLLVNKYTRFINGNKRAAGASEIAIAAAIELIHEASLIHDDIVDRSEMRRGLPTFNFAYGDAMAILVGDYLFTRSTSIFLEQADKVSDLRIVSKFIDLAIRTVRGEINQLHQLLFLEPNQERISLEAYLDIISAKTAVFFGACCEAGAVLAGGRNELVNNFFDFGLNLGIQFQIVDDLLDVVGSEKKVGKSLRQNMREKTITLPFIIAYNHHRDNPVMRKLISGADLTARESNQVYRWMSIPSVVQETREYMNRYTVLSQQALSRMPQCIYRLALEDYLAFVTARDF